MRIAFPTALIRAAAIAAVAALPATALAQNTLVKTLTVDPAAQKADAERQIIDIIQQNLGALAVIDTGGSLSAEIDEQIVPGNTLPAGAPVSELPAKIDGKLPQITPGARWVGVGEHLVELGEGDRIETVLYDALP